MGACVNTKAMNDTVSYSTFHSSCFFFFFRFGRCQSSQSAGLSIALNEDCTGSVNACLM